MAVGVSKRLRRRHTDDTHTRPGDRNTSTSSMTDKRLLPRLLFIIISIFSVFLRVFTVLDIHVART